MNHAFLVNVHNDAHQASRLCRILLQHYPESDRRVYCDGVHSRHLAQGLEAGVHAAEYEPNKVVSIMTALNALVLGAWKRGTTHASFLHADMVPTDVPQFYRFLKRFAASGKALTYNTMWAEHPLIDFCNLHFDVKQVVEMGLFPVEVTPISDQPRWVNEAQLTVSFSRSCPTWRDHTYQPWTIVLPYTRMPGTTMDKHGHLPDGCFVFHNYTPETSVIHTNDPWFWDNYDTIARRE